MQVIFNISRGPQRNFRTCSFEAQNRAAAPLNQTRPPATRSVELTVQPRDRGQSSPLDDDLHLVQKNIDAPQGNNDHRPQHAVDNHAKRQTHTFYPHSRHVIFRPTRSPPQRIAIAQSATYPIFSRTAIYDSGSSDPHPANWTRLFVQAKRAQSRPPGLHLNWITTHKNPNRATAAWLPARGEALCASTLRHGCQHTRRMA